MEDLKEQLATAIAQLEYVKSRAHRDPTGTVHRQIRDMERHVAELRAKVESAG